MSFDVVITGDSIVNRAISSCTDAGFRRLREVVSEASVAFTHFEGVCHDYAESGVYPAAMSGGTWTRAPRESAAELDWMGFDMVSHASNHALDYSYGGLRETWQALDNAAVEHAGTGPTLADAREPAYVATENRRVGLVSMTSSFPDWSRAGDARPDVRGRPGVNPLRYDYAVDAETFEAVETLGRALGLVVMATDEEVVLMGPESRNATWRFERSDDDGIRRILHEDDRDANLRAIERASNNAEIVIAHVHTHEFRLGGTAAEPPLMLEEFSRACVAAGADVVVNQGSHAPTRGIEIHDGAPIFYDPGEFILQSSTVTRQPADYYESYADVLETTPQAATPAEGMAARGFDLPWEGDGFAEESAMQNPPGGFFVGPGSVLGRCTFTDAGDLETIDLEPVSWLSTPKANTGVPVAAGEDTAREIIDYLAEQSAPYGTTIERDGTSGTISL